MLSCLCLAKSCNLHACVQPSVPSSMPNPALTNAHLKPQIEPWIVRKWHHWEAYAPNCKHHTTEVPTSNSFCKWTGRRTGSTTRRPNAQTFNNPCLCTIQRRSINNPAEPQRPPVKPEHHAAVAAVRAFSWAMGSFASLLQATQKLCLLRPGVR